jgi:acetoin utilization deacetylase AcuC-like enzyme
LPEGTGDVAFHRALDEVLVDAVTYAPDLVLFQAGVDGLEADALGRFALSPEGMSRRNERVFAMCRSRSTPCVVFMGGGYSQPIDATLDAFEDLFSTAAHAHQRYVP